MANFFKMKENKEYKTIFAGGISENEKKILITMM
jgi:hypothetical protein